jgi:hypothetical protein
MHITYENKEKLLNEEKGKEKSKKEEEERTGGVIRTHGEVRDPAPGRTRHRSLRATGCSIGFADAALP